MPRKERQLKVTFDENGRRWQNLLPDRTYDLPEIKNDTIDEAEKERRRRLVSPLFSSNVKRCTANRSKGRGPCRGTAINGTDKCRVHGGKIRVKHGRYSKYLNKALQVSFDEAMEQETTDLREEMGLLRLMLGRALAGFSKAVEAQSARGEVLAVGLVNEILGNVQKMAATIARIEASKSITPEHVKMLVSRIISVLDTELGPQQMKRISAQLTNIRLAQGIQFAHSDTAGDERTNDGIQLLPEPVTEEEPATQEEFTQEELEGVDDDGTYDGGSNEVGSNEVGGQDEELEEGDPGDESGRGTSDDEAA